MKTIALYAVNHTSVVFKSTIGNEQINGLCGRLYCCLKYEDDIYTEFRKDLPEVGDKVKYEGVEGTVITLDIPRRRYVLLTEDNNKIEVIVPFKQNESRRKGNK